MKVKMMIMMMMMIIIIIIIMCVLKSKFINWAAGSLLLQSISLFIYCRSILLLMLKTEFIYKC